MRRKIKGEGREGGEGWQGGRRRRESRSGGRAGGERAGGGGGGGGGAAPRRLCRCRSGTRGRRRWQPGRWRRRGEGGAAVLLLPRPLLLPGSAARRRLPRPGPAPPPPLNRYIVDIRRLTSPSPPRRALHSQQRYASGAAPAAAPTPAAGPSHGERRTAALRIAAALRPPRPSAGGQRMRRTGSLPPAAVCMCVCARQGGACVRAYVRACRQTPRRGSRRRPRGALGTVVCREGPPWRRGRPEGAPRRRLWRWGGTGQGATGRAKSTHPRQPWLPAGPPRCRCLRYFARSAPRRNLILLVVAIASAQQP